LAIIQFPPFHHAVFPGKNQLSETSTYSSHFTDFAAGCQKTAIGDSCGGLGRQLFLLPARLLLLVAIRQLRYIGATGFTIRADRWLSR